MLPANEMKALFPKKILFDVHDVALITRDPELLTAFRDQTEKAGDGPIFALNLCHRCRKLKKKCSKHKPRCLGCYKTGYDCVYDRKTPTPTSPRVVLPKFSHQEELKLQQRLQLLQQRKHEQIIPDKPPRPRGRPRIRPRTPPPARAPVRPVVVAPKEKAPEVDLEAEKKKKEEEERKKKEERESFLYRYPYVDLVQGAVPPPWVVFQHKVSEESKKVFPEEEEEDRGEMWGFWSSDEEEGDEQEENEKKEEKVEFWKVLDPVLFASS